MAGKDFLRHTKEAKLASRILEYDFLNEKGIHELEIILSLLFKERNIKTSPMMVTIASILLVFMKPGEVYHVLSEMIKITQKDF
jgi:hypothetical protein